MFVSFPLCSYIGGGGGELKENVLVHSFWTDTQKGIWGPADEKKA